MQVLLLMLVAASLPTIIRGQLIGLSEQDYSIPVGSSDLTVQVNIQGVHTGNITLDIIPLTFSQYETLFPQLPCGSVQDLARTDNHAESDDFDSTVQSKVVVPDEGNSFRFSIAITEDESLEVNEVFLVYLNVSAEDPDQVTIDQSRRCAIGRIVSQTSNTEVFRMEPLLESIRVSESAGRTVAFNLVRIVDTDLDININIQAISSSAMEGEDFSIPIRSFVMTPNMSSIEIAMEILEDLVAEEDETFTLEATARVSGITIRQTVDMDIIIADNEVVEIGFEDDVVYVTEDSNSIRLVIELVNISIRDFHRSSESFQLVTSDGTARAGVDYEPLAASYSPFSSLGRYTITLIDNDEIDTTPERDFTFDITSPETELTRFGTSSVRVVIVDDDRLPLAPNIQNAEPIDPETLEITWISEVVLLHPVTSFVGTVRPVNDAAGTAANFTITDPTVDTHTLEDFANATESYEIVICAVNKNGQTCSDPYLILSPTEPPTVNSTEPPVVVMPAGLPADLPPGLIAGIIVAILVLLCCCLLVLLLFIWLCCKIERERSYWPARAERKELKGKSVESNSNSYEDDDDEEDLAYIKQAF